MTTVNTQNQAKEAIYARFIAAWGSETPYVFGNEAYTPPAGAGGAAGSWVRLTVREAIAAQNTLGPAGARKFRRRGTILLMVYALADKGEQRADAIVKKFRDTFEGVSFDGVNGFTCQVVEHGNEGAWFRVNALQTFDFYETK